MTMNDEQLLLETGRGDRKAFRSLFDEYAGKLLRFVGRMIGQCPESEELLQEIMLKIWTKAPLFDPDKGKARTWIYQVSRRTVLNWIASKAGQGRKHEVFTESPIEDLCAAPEPSPELLALHQESAQGALQGLAKLPPDLREAVVLRFIEGMGIPEIAQIAECPEGTVKSRIFYGLRKLREILSQEEKHAAAP